MPYYILKQNHSYGGELLEGWWLLRAGGRPFHTNDPSTWDIATDEAVAWNNAVKNGLFRYEKIEEVAIALNAFITGRYCGIAHGVTLTHC